MTELVTRVAQSTGLAENSVAGVIRLLSEGNTVPFIARYRKEMTGAMDETGIRRVQETHAALRELLQRRQTVLDTIDRQGKLTPALRAQIEACWDRQALEDLYLPYKPRRRTRADAAREAGLAPLAEMLLGQRPAPGAPLAAARAFVQPDKGVKTPQEALAGARDIAAEVVTSVPQVRGAVRDLAARTAHLASARKRGAGEEAEAWRDYFDHRERLSRVAPHRLLAVLRGEEQGALSVRLDVDDERGRSLVRKDHLRRVPDAWRRTFLEAVDDGWKRLLWPAIQRELLAAAKERADQASVAVFEENLRALLMAPPERGRRVLGVDPGFRNGCKMAAIDATGKVLATATIYPHAPQQRADEARTTLRRLVERHRLDVLAVGDGTAHRETMALLEGMEWPRPVTVEPTREAGASVYSASEMAAQELPDMDVTLRGAVSIARRFQDPLAELVKIDPRSLGVGQYQHDVDQKLLAAGLEAVVEECVNRVGVEVNTASVPLLARVAGIGPTLAGAIVQHRDRHGSFASRRTILDVAGLGPARFTQCAGFLRIRDGREPLDRTGIHPERYGWVRGEARRLGLDVSAVLGDAEQVARFEQDARLADGVGRQTFADIVAELARPGHDPRGERERFAFDDTVHSVEDLKVGMILPGRVTSVTDFGAFVDIGVHRDGLVHISQMADRRVNSPFDVCRPFQTVRVRVVEVDRKRNRIGLSMKPSELAD